jgi:hypothetical protein
MLQKANSALQRGKIRLCILVKGAINSYHREQSGMAHRITAKQEVKNNKRNIKP